MYIHKTKEKKKTPQKETNFGSFNQTALHIMMITIMGFIRENQRIIKRKKLCINNRIYILPAQEGAQESRNLYGEISRERHQKVQDGIENLKGSEKIKEQSNFC